MGRKLRAASRRVRGFALLVACVGVVLVFGALSLFAASAPMFARPTSYATGVSPVSVAIGDLSGDGAPDLAVATSSNLDTVSVLLNVPTARSRQGAST